MLNGSGKPIPSTIDIIPDGSINLVIPAMKNNKPSEIRRKVVPYF